MYLLDTDILSNLLKRTPSTMLIAKLAAMPAQQQFTTSITLGELVYGAYRKASHTTSLMAQIEKVLLAKLSVLPFDAVAARHYGALKAGLERKGIILGEADLRIGAIALSRGLTVVTANVRHLQRIPGLNVENWLAG